MNKGKPASMQGCGVAMAVAALLFTPLASAHAGLEKSVPGSRAVLGKSPPQIELCFNEAVELKFSSIQLLAPDGSAIAAGKLGLGDTPRCLRASLPLLQKPGVYTVKYKVLSQDGHLVDYGYTFTLQAAAE